MPFRPIELMESLEEKARKLKGWWDEEVAQAEEQALTLLSPEPARPDLPENLRKRYEPPGRQQLPPRQRVLRSIEKGHGSVAGATVIELEGPSSQVDQSSGEPGYWLPNGPAFDPQALDRNIAEVEQRVKDSGGSWTGKAENFAWWFNRVRNGGEWDYKQKAKTYEEVGDTRRLGPSPYEDFGNFHYGATAAALGLPLEIALRGAGWASVEAVPEREKRYGSWHGDPPYGDEPWDQGKIRAGYNYYNKVWTKKSGSQ